MVVFVEKPIEIYLSSCHEEVEKQDNIKPSDDQFSEIGYRVTEEITHTGDF